MHCFVLMKTYLNVELLLGELYRKYINLKRQKDALEIAIKEADWAYGTKHGEERNKLCSDACNRIGEVLESMGRFAVAGDIYDNAGGLYNYETNTFHYNVAIAYTRSGLYDKAERTFIRSLYVSSPDSNGSIDAPVCNSILLHYNMWGRTVTGSDETTNVHCTCANLLFYAGIASLTERIGTYGPDIMKKVIEACTSDNVNDFRAIVCRIKNLWYSLFLRTKSRSFRPNTMWIFLRKYRRTRCARKLLRLTVLVKIVTMW